MLFLRSLFARCLRVLKRIEGVARSPVYAQLSSTIKGSQSHSVVSREKIASDRFLYDLDQNTRAHYLQETIHAWAAYGSISLLSLSSR